MILTKSSNQYVVALIHTYSTSLKFNFVPPKKNRDKISQDNNLILLQQFIKDIVLKRNYSLEIDT